MRIRMNTYGPSRSGRDLARRLGIRRLLNNGRSRYRPRPSDIIINWGDANLRPMNVTTINKPPAVRAATRKEVALGIFKENGVPCPDFTTDKEVANEWLQEQGTQVVCRGLRSGHSGRGITIVGGDSPSGAEDLPSVPLYTRYVKKRDEFRVFVVAGRVVRVAQKRRRRGTDVDYRVRNHGGGWVYCTDRIVCPEPVHRAGLDAVRVLGLDFGAADVGYNAHYDTACVYEVNTAFGLEGTTLDIIADAIQKEWLND